MISDTAKESNAKKGLIMKSLRVALLGSLKGPDLITTWVLLSKSGQDRTRISSVI